MKTITSEGRLAVGFYLALTSLLFAYLILRPCQQRL